MPPSPVIVTSFVVLPMREVFPAKHLIWKGSYDRQDESIITLVLGLIIIRQNPSYDVMLHGVFLEL